MKVGIPKGLLYYKYYPFIQSFFNTLGAELVVSPDTNKEILNLGAKYAVDEACLPIKVFHGHVASIKDHCDLIFVPRIMRLKEKESICPKFCGLPEMIQNSIPDMPPITMLPIYAGSKKELYHSFKSIGLMITKNKSLIDSAFHTALQVYEQFQVGIKNTDYPINIALVGHYYSLYDSFLNMDIIKKLNELGIGIITEEFVSPTFIEEEVNHLFKKPFWTFAKNTYGAVTFLARQKQVDGIVYLSSFACGIDSIVIELIKEQTQDFPFLILKFDEHTGEAGFDTRIEAFADMLERRHKIENNLPSHG